jgi:hypothetical protein
MRLSGAAAATTWEWLKATTYQSAARTVVPGI